jgi:hypothetical protein
MSQSKPKFAQKALKAPNHPKLGPKSKVEPWIRREFFILKRTAFWLRQILELGAPALADLAQGLSFLWRGPSLYGATPAIGGDPTIQQAFGLINIT